MSMSINEPASPNAGELDPGFNGGAILPLLGQAAMDVALSPTGKIYVAGNTTLGSDSEYLIWALNTDGTADQSFNGGVPVHWLFTPDTESTSNSDRISVLPDGKILILGRTLVNRSQMYFGLARYHPDGTLDRSFGMNGISVPIHGYDDVTLVKNFPRMADTPKIAYQRASLFVRDGRYYIAGAALRPSNGRAVILLVCLDDSGHLAQDFGDKGTAVIEHLEHYLDAPVILVTPQGYLYVAGRIIGLESHHYKLWVRMHLDGRVDSSFGSDGFVYDMEGGYGGYGSYEAVALQASLKPLGVGFGLHSDAAVGYAMMTSIDNDGASDPDFNDGEPVLTPIVPASYWADCMIQSDGRIVTCGPVLYQDDEDHRECAVGRYLPDGSLDTGFGNHNGWTQMRLGRTVEDLALAVQPDNAIVVVGNQFDADLRSQPFVLRLKG